MRIPTIVLAAALLLPGCALDPRADDVPRSGDYHQGWRDGCVSGLYLRNLRLSGTAHADDRFVHDLKRWRDSSEYAIGWGDGLRSCDAGRPGSDRSPRPERR